jgi:phenylpyruvate tautomerase PptA (4-oxalocrotonate tautomerase family)
MPYITIRTAAKLTGQQMDTVKAELGKLIEMIPGKSESGLMIAFEDGTMYLRGQNAASCAFLEIRLYGKAPSEAKSQFVHQVFRMLEQTLGIKENEAYINILEFDAWGSAGVWTDKQ